MPTRDVIAMAASAGGIETLREVLAGMPADLPASVLVVLHMPATGSSSLPQILGRATELPVAAARDGEPLLHGRVYCCVPGQHLLVGDQHLHVRRGPSENGHRPAADPLFRSAAGALGPRVIGVILSGTLSDGTAGLATIRQRGGLAVVQDPADALYSGMATSALELVGADHVATAKEMGPLLAELTAEEVSDGWDPPEGDLARELDVARGDEVALMGDHPGTPSVWPCPDCSGVLWAVEQEPVLRFRCRVGHAWSAENLLHEQAQGVEGALWVALRALEDRVALGAAMAAQAEQSGRRISAAHLRSDLGELQTSAATLREVLERGMISEDAPEAISDG